MRVIRVLQHKALIVLFSASCALLPLHAATDIDFGAAVRVDDTGDVFLAISARYFDSDRETLSRWEDRYRDPDDLAVALFISRHSGRSLEAVYELRRSGLSWWEISLRFGIAVDVWFAPVDRDPGPPYGKAHGYWKKRRPDRDSRVGLSDGDLRDLVALRVVHEYYGVSVDLAMEWRSSGSDLPQILSREYKNRHGKQKKTGSKDAGKKNGHHKTKHGAADRP